MLLLLPRPTTPKKQTFKNIKLEPELERSHLYSPSEDVKAKAAAALDLHICITALRVFAALHYPSPSVTQQLD